MSGPKQGDLFGAVGAPAKAQPEKQPVTKQPLEKLPLTPTLSPLSQGEGVSRGPLSQGEGVSRAPPLASGEALPGEKVPAWRRLETPAKRAEPRVLTVSQLTGQVKDLLEPQFARVLVRGEVSNFRGVNARGHLYFALKDERASIDVKVWATQAQRLKFKLKDGMALVIEGSLDVYEPQGRYSLIANRLEPEGMGAQALAFEQLKQKLIAEGLIGEGRTRPRRPLPFLPRRIGVVTSVTGAALRDFLKVLHRRHPRLSVLVADARMQGDEAIFEVRRALRWLSRSDVDVIVITRGGGSVEDLWTFNEEPVVRAVWDCPVPVVSAVGHEIDTTLCDLVADVRAPTPSAAAELLAPSLVDLEAQLATLRARAARAVEKQLVHERSELRALQGALGDPRRQLSREHLRLAEATERMAAVLRRRQRAGAGELKELTSRLQRARPQAQLQARRGELTALREALGRQLPRRLREERETLARLGAALAPLVSRQVRGDREALGRLRTALPLPLARRLRSERETFGRLATALARHSPRPLLAQGRQLFARQAQRLPAAMRLRVQREREQLSALTGRLHALSPLAVLSRGYAIAQRDDGRVVRGASDVQVGEQLTLTLGGNDTLTAQVTQVKRGGK